MTHRALATVMLFSSSRIGQLSTESFAMLVLSARRRDTFTWRFALQCLLQPAALHKAPGELSVCRSCTGCDSERQSLTGADR